MAELRAEIGEGLTGGGLDPAVVARVIRTALAEDLDGGSDVTTVATIGAQALGRADVVARDPGIVAGLVVAEAVFSVIGGDDSREGIQRVSVRHCAADGDRVQAKQVLMTVSGPLRAILTAERTALNLLGHMSGIATLTGLWADAVAGTGARIRDTRKTLPGLRVLEKYAVRCGGGVNHRMSLWDAALIKDNHVAAAGSVTAALDAVGKLAPDLPVEVECDTVQQVEEAGAAGAGLILLGNFSVRALAGA